jgi:hypothetical protein
VLPGLAFRCSETVTMLAFYKYIFDDFWNKIFDKGYTICTADNATAGSLGRRRTGQLRFGLVAVSAGHIVYPFLKCV